MPRQCRNIKEWTNKGEKKNSCVLCNRSVIQNGNRIFLQALKLMTCKEKLTIVVHTTWLSD